MTAPYKTNCSASITFFLLDTNNIVIIKKEYCRRTSKAAIKSEYIGSSEKTDDINLHKKNKLTRVINRELSRKLLYAIVIFFGEANIENIVNTINDSA
jgi:hypothetical protein